MAVRGRVRVVGKEGSTSKTERRGSGIPNKFLVEYVELRAESQVLGGIFHVLSEERSARERLRPAFWGVEVKS